MLSALYVGDRLAAAHMGMRSASVWHYWFPAYDPELSKYSPGLILLLRMAQAAPSLGLRVIDLGKGSTLYKDRLMSGEVPLAEGRVELPSLATAVRRLRRGTEAWVRRSPLVGVARGPGRLLKRAERWWRLR